MSEEDGEGEGLLYLIAPTEPQRGSQPMGGLLGVETTDGSCIKRQKMSEFCV